MIRKPQIELRPSPHIHAPRDVIVIMRNVVLALLPVLGWYVWMFGLSAIALLAAVLAGALGAERLANRLRGEDSSLGDYSALITAILLAMTIPPAMPMWMGFVAGAVAIGLGKVFFGGLGFNVFNPALIGRAFVQAAFPVAVNTWPPAFFEGRFSTFIPSTTAAPFMHPPSITEWGMKVMKMVDAYSGATPLAMQKFQHQQTPVWELVFGGATPYATGAPAALIILCGLYLAARRMLDWRIPLSVMAGAAGLAAILWLYDPARYPDPLFVLASGGLMLGAWFMATDMVGSPVTSAGAVIYGLLIGVITVVIRLFGGMAEGVMYAILLGNAATPLIEHYTQPKPFGAKRRRGGRGGS